MEKKGDLFNQLAIISDLIERCNLVSVSSTVVFELNRAEFEKVYTLVTRKTKMSGGMPKDTFNIQIGEVNILFNMSNA
jgi:CRP-like cAMP-binding protein